MDLFSNDIRYFFALTKSFIGVKSVQSCLELFETPEALFKLPEKSLKKAGLKPKEIAQLKNSDWTSIDKELKQCEKMHCYVLSYFDRDYPERLRETPDPPLILYVRGNKQLLSELQIAMVGTRNPTRSAFETAKQFAATLTKAGIVVTSGLAQGVDAASHEGALSEGATIAVMGTGINEIYPPSNRKLAEKIIEKGAIVSEFSLNEKPKAKNFPIRNRIISGLSVGTLVVEAALRSGSLITARIAAEQGREVFAIPGSIHNPLARGCHQLLRQGAKLVETAEDILEELAPFVGDLFFDKKSLPETSKLADKIDKIHRHVFDQIGFETTPFDTIIVRSGLTASEVSSILLVLEVKDLVQSVSGGYIRNTFKSESYV